MSGSISFDARLAATEDYHSYCLRVITKLKSTNLRGEYCMIAKEINSQKPSFQACDICHEQRENNIEALRLGHF